MGKLRKCDTGYIVDRRQWDALGRRCGGGWSLIIKDPGGRGEWEVSTYRTRAQAQAILDRAWKIHSDSYEDYDD